jgi:CheY-like chemotaxis protein
MDLGMPTMSGLEAARRIRSREREQKREPLPIIALTAHTYDEDISKCKAAGMNDFVSKPIQEARLLDTIRRWSEVLED